MTCTAGIKTIVCSCMHYRYNYVDFVKLCDIDLSCIACCVIWGDDWEFETRFIL